MQGVYVYVLAHINGWISPQDFLFLPHSLIIWLKIVSVRSERQESVNDGIGALFWEGHYVIGYDSYSLLAKDEDSCE